MKVDIDINEMKINQPETHSTEVLLSTIEELERTKKQLDKAKKSMISALQSLACMDRISEEKCNEQLAFDELRKTLEELEK